MITSNSKPLNVAAKTSHSLWFCVDGQQQISFASPQFLSFFFDTKQPTATLKLKDLERYEPLWQFIDSNLKACLGGEALNTSFTLNVKDTPVVYQCVMSPNWVSNQEEMILVSLIESGGQQQALAALARSEARFRDLANNIPGAIFQYQLFPDNTDRMNYMSDGCLDIWEIPAEEVRNDPKPLWDMIIESDLPSMQKSVMESAQNLSDWEAEYTIVTPSGKTKVLMARGTPTKMPDGSVLWNSLNIDITAQRNAEQALQIKSNELALAVSSAKLGLWRYSPEQDKLDWDQQLFRIYGLDSESFKPTMVNFLNRVHDDDRAEIDKRYQDLLRDGFVSDHQFRVLGDDRQWRYVNATGSVVRDRYGLVKEVIGVNYDITDFKRTEQRLLQSAAVFENTYEGIMLTDNQGTIVDVNRAMLSMTGLEKSKLIGTSSASLYSRAHTDRFYQGIWVALRKDGRWQGEVRVPHEDGLLVPCLLSINQILDKGDGQVGYVSVFSNISALKKTQQRLDFLAHHDALTELPNRLLLYQRLEQSIARAKRHDRQFAIAFLDVDEFKTINDSLGHAVGDLLLCELAARLTSLTRTEDTVARLSGDEFVVLIEEIDKLDTVTHIIEKLMTVIKHPFLVETHKLNVTISVGVCVYPEDGDTLSDLMRNADVAMYEAKKQGRNQFQFYAKHLTEQASEQMFFYNALRDALNNQEFYLHYQPQVNMQDRSMVGVEALLRWRHPAEGVIPPDVFIPQAERSGIIKELGLWVIYQVCQDLHQWLSEALPIQKVAINVSGKQFLDGAFVTDFKQIVTKAGVPFDRLEVEVTENILMLNEEHAIEQLERLRDTGCSVAIDDFGTGFSSLSYLKKLPINQLKIDKSFIQDIPDDENDVAITEAVIVMSQAMGLEVLAEGVETEQQSEFLLARGCDRAQGYLYAKPMSAKDIAKAYRNGS